MKKVYKDTRTKSTEKGEIIEIFKEIYPKGSHLFIIQYNYKNKLHYYGCDTIQKTAKMTKKIVNDIIAETNNKDSHPIVSINFIYFNWIKCIERFFCFCKGLIETEQEEFWEEFNKKT